MKSLAKKLTLLMLLIGFIVGVVGMFLPSFNMERYTVFVKAFAFLYTPLIASIGINSSVAKIKGETSSTKGVGN